MSLEKLFKKNKKINIIRTPEENIYQVRDICLDIDNNLKSENEIKEFVSTYLKFVDSYKSMKENINEKKLGYKFYQYKNIIRGLEEKRKTYDSLFSEYLNCEQIQDIAEKYTQGKTLKDLF